MMLPVFALYALTAVLNVANIVQPYRLALRAYVHAAINGAYCVIALILLSVHNLITVSASAHATAKLVDVAHWLNGTAHWTVATVAVVCAISAYCDLRQLRHTKPVALRSTANGVA
jgi:hypothetical protein